MPLAEGGSLAGRVVLVTGAGSGIVRAAGGATITVYGGMPCR